MSKQSSYLPYKQNNYKIIRDREIGARRCIGDEDDISRKIYTNLDVQTTHKTFTPSTKAPLHVYNSDQGGIFNFDFNPEGKLLVAACEGKSILIFDSWNQRSIKTIEAAHLKCVNCVRFLDSNMFASCSDDGTVKTWDLRFFRAPTRTLQGHTNWVKNIEYSEKEKVMVTSGFDGNIFSWDLNNYTECSVVCTKIFSMMGLMRMKLTPDDSRMIMTTTNGYLMVVHDLNLSTMPSDLQDFRPNLYRLMQLSEEPMTAAAAFNPMFTAVRNRVEFIDDFANQAEVVSSIQIHPMGWCCLTRNLSTDSEIEWTCVHDIQMKEPSEYEDFFTHIPSSDSEAEEQQHQLPSSPDIPPRFTDIWMSYQTHERIERNRAQRPPTSEIFTRGTTGTELSGGLMSFNSYDGNLESIDEKRRVAKNFKRLTHSIMELSAGRGYIKEFCFSTDGRIICSPYGKGVRLLAFNEDCQELNYCVPEEPKELFVVSKLTNYHGGVVASCKFNPRQYQLVSGCLNGDIVWYAPIL